MQTTEIVNFLKEKVELFRAFEPDKLKTLVQGARLTTFEAHEAVVEFGEEGRFLGVLLAGEAEVSVADDTGRRHVLTTLVQGDIFGEMALMTGDKTVADVIGKTRCKALFIPQKLFSAELITHPPAVQYLAKALTKQTHSMVADDDTRRLSAAALQKSGDPYGLKLQSDEPVKALVINCGSSSLKYTFFDTADDTVEVRGLVENIGADPMAHHYKSGEQKISRELPKGSHREAFEAMMSELGGPEAGIIASPAEISVVGHRVVHGGDKFHNPVIVDQEVLAEIEKLSELAPLHNPINLLGIREAMRVFPHACHVAVFDTTFHNTLPAYAYLYGLPYELYEEQGIRKYGFHGISHFYVSLKAAEFLKRPFNELELITCHLGNGASMCAVDHGRSVDTSMGLTPTQGLIMGTRCGDIDPAVLVHLMRHQHLSADELDRLINKQSGLKGLSGISNDMRDIEGAAEKGHHRALLAFKTFCYQIRKYIGAYVAAMQGLDAVIFTGGIGQGSAAVRSMACQRLDYMGIRIDEEKNRNARGFSEITDISEEGSAVRVLVIPTDEERMIARESLRTMDSAHIEKILHAQKDLPVPIEISAHHVHLSQAHVEALFGPRHELTPEAELSQPGQFACKETVTLIGPKGKVERVRVLGPTRNQTQVEISMTEQFKLGIHPPIRESGSLENTPGITLEGAYGRVALDKGVICAMRHIHMSPEDALRFGLKDKFMVRVRVSGDRELIFGDVLVRVSPKYRLAMHIDTDEGNAANIRTGMTGTVDGIQSRG